MNNTRLYRPSKGYNGAPNTSPPRHPERLAERLAWIREHHPLEDRERR